MAENRKLSDGMKCPVCGKQETLFYEEDGHLFCDSCSRQPVNYLGQLSAHMSIGMFFTIPAACVFAAYALEYWSPMLLDRVTAVCLMLPLIAAIGFTVIGLIWRIKLTREAKARGWPVGPYELRRHQTAEDRTCNARIGD